MTPQSEVSKNAEKNEENFGELKVTLSYMQRDIQETKSDVKDIKGKVAQDYVTKDQMDTRVKPLENLVYGLVGLILIGFATAVIGLVVLRPK